MSTVTPINQNQPEKQAQNTEPRSGRILAGLVLVLIGTVLFADQFGNFFPHWLISWQMLLIAIGLFSGAKSSFRGIGWLIPIAVGGVFLLDEFFPDLAFRHYFWPLIIIFIGLYMIARPKRKKKDRWWDQPVVTGALGEDRIDYTAVFGSVKKNIISKDFKGGDVTGIFGGAEINLTQADIQGTVTMDLTTVFGGVKLLVPPHWQLRTTDVVTVLGGLEDKRPIIKDAGNQLSGDKILNLSGVCILGGIEIKSY